MTKFLIQRDIQNALWSARIVCISPGHLSHTLLSFISLGTSRTCIKRTVSHSRLNNRGLSTTTNQHIFQNGFNYKSEKGIFTIVYKHMLILTSHLELENDRRTVETSFSFSVNFYS